MPWWAWLATGLVTFVGLPILTGKWLKWVGRHYPEPGAGERLWRPEDDEGD